MPRSGSIARGELVWPSARAAGIVANRRDGRMIYYRLDDAHVRMLLDLSREHGAHQLNPGAGKPDTSGDA